MMNPDRFKFRVWDNDLDEWVDPDHLSIAPDGLLNVKYDPDNFACIEDGRLIIIQCTGLKDKNGKLIYEGDILTFSLDGSSDGPCPVPGEVTHSDANASLIISYLSRRCSISFSISKDIEIIGNIYENPELLNDTSS